MICLTFFGLSAILPIIVCSSLSSSLETLEGVGEISLSGQDQQDTKVNVDNSTSDCISSMCQNDTVSGTPPSIFETLEVLVVLQGAPSQAVSCKAEGNPTPEIKWMFNHQNLSDDSIIQVRKDNTSYLIFPTMEVKHSGNYTCIAENDLAEARTTLAIHVIDDKELAPICIQAEDLQLDRNASNTIAHSPVRNKRFLWHHWVKSKGSTDPNQDLQSLVNLIARRLLLADKVAVAKWDTNKPIEDAPREEIILQTVVKQAQDTGVDPNWARVFFRDQIEANKDIQNGLFAKWRKQGERSPGPTVDLQKEVRPLIDQINEELITLSTKTNKVRNSWFCRRKVGQITRYTTLLHGFDYLHQKALQRAVSHLCP